MSRWHARIVIELKENATISDRVTGVLKNIIIF